MCATTPGRWSPGAAFPEIDGRPAIGLGQRRLRLDQLLFEAARSTPGVAAYTGVAVEAPLVERGRVIGLVVAGEQRRGTLLVVADGAHSLLRRRLGLDGKPPRRRRVGLRTHFKLAEGQPSSCWIEVFLGSGYELYVTPLPAGEILVAGLAEAQALTAGAEASFRRWLDEQPVLSQRLTGARRLTPLMGRAPLASTARAGVIPGAVLLGDAAGFIDPITGGGMTQALMTAELLTRYVPRVLEEGHVWLERFERERRALLRDYMLLTSLVLALAARPVLARLTLRLLRARPALFSHLIGVSGGIRRLTGGVLEV
ncbi:MAG: hypothetical protein KatS3mg057_0777 [Herpetosiphonaceae bacterium]|nr:MAG: hypothetical protein KatS3mg057_0777 [Herpetosiphonaceae bacterium]